jgi:ABC-2 type transport system permease protein
MIYLFRGFGGARDLTWGRVWAVTRKEIREYRRNRSVLVAIGIFPAIFLIQPLISIFVAPAGAAALLRHSDELLYLLGIPILVPPTLAAYAITGERQQGTLEPVLTTPIRREELIVGKALAAAVPSMVMAYLVYAVFLVLVSVFADPAISSAIVQSQDVVVQIVYTPLLAAATTWIGLAISTRSTDQRVAQQLSILGSLPLLIGTIVLAFDIVHPTTGLLIGIGVVLFALDAQGWRIVSPMFDRERLITGTRA